MKLNEQGTTRIYVTLGTKFETRNSFQKGMIGPITSRNTRYIFAVSNGTYEVGQVNVTTGELLDTQNYGPDNNRDAQKVLTAFLNS
jgi:hypothetical protein